MYVPRFKNHVCHALLIWQYGTGLPDFAWYKIPKRGKMYQITTNFTKCPQNRTKDRKMDQVSMKYTIVFHCKTLQNLPKFGYFVLKQTIWQPWYDMTPFSLSQRVSFISEFPREIC
jgi:hypothetical protein